MPREPRVRRFYSSRSDDEGWGRNGFTVVELIVALAVAAILAGLAVPAMTSLVRDMRLRTVTGDLLSGLSLARMEAIKRRKRVTVCTSRNKESCGRNIGWQFGWLVFEDGNGNGKRDSGEPLVFVAGGEATGSQLSITGNAPVRDYVSYTPLGVTQTASGALQMGTITVCQADAGRKIVVNIAGRPRVERLAEC